jgi:hypothetical protein
VLQFFVPGNVLLDACPTLLAEDNPDYLRKQAMALLFFPGIVVVFVLPALGDNTGRGFGRKIQLQEPVVLILPVAGDGK